MTILRRMYANIINNESLALFYDPIFLLQIYHNRKFQRANLEHYRRKSVVR